MVVAFIPARGGSKSIPLKNIKLLSGKPLIFWSIAALQNAACVDEIIVATDSEEIAKAVAGFNFSKAKIYRRKAENATDTATTESVMLEYIEQSNLQKSDIFVLVQATSPLTQTKHFKEALELYNKNKYDSLLSCVRNYRFFWEESGTSKNYDYKNRPRRQDFAGQLMENGAFYINTIEGIKKSQNRLCGKIGIYEMPEYTAIEIDELNDWIVAEQLFNCRMDYKEVYIMKRIIIFGAGGFGIKYSNDVLQSGEDKIVCFLDNSKAKQGTQLNGIDVLAPEKIHELIYDAIIVTAPGLEDDIVQQLKELGVDENKIKINDGGGGGVEEGVIAPIKTRKTWLSDFAKIIYERNIIGNVAEAGVFRGDFAKHINTVFPDKILYLFDTFEGFPAQDVEKEELPSNSKAGYLDFTSEELVLSKLPHKERAVVKKGYFPQSAQGIDDKFCFVNLDLDLYQPTLEGLKFFWDKMSEGGVILIHDYFGIDFPNVKTAVADFEKWLGEPLKMLPIGDTLSIAIVKI